MLSFATSTCCFAYRKCAVQYPAQYYRRAMSDKCAKNLEWLLHFDGGSRGNPGVAGAGAVLSVTDANYETNEIWSGQFYLGKNVTNNVAEYHGILEGLKQCVRLG